MDELAPRDQVALAIEQRLREQGTRSVGLDLRPVDLARFPNIADALAAEGIDPTRDLVPVAPASHYTMGGVATDLDGRAIAGRPAGGGRVRLHGTARRQPAGVELAGRVLRAGPPGRAARRAGRRPAVPAQPAGAEPAPLPAPPSDATRAALWRHAGLRRDPEGLRELAGDPFPLARLIAAAALAREESRGAHQRVDHPETDPALDGHHVLLGPGEQRRGRGVGVSPGRSIAARVRRAAYPSCSARPWRTWRPAWP